MGARGGTCQEGVWLGESGGAVAGWGRPWAVGVGVDVGGLVVLVECDWEVEMGGDGRWKFNVEREID